MVVSKKNYNFPRFQRGSNIYQGGGPTFSRGIQMLISIETDITCPDPLSPLLDPCVIALG